ncbi:MAG: hypothetical protein U0X93_04115 [Anaerolineales bacterium]
MVLRKRRGSQFGLEVDRHIIPIELSEQEHEDLVAFLYALTDESAMPNVPASVPSGLPRWNNTPTSRDNAEG